MQVGLEWRLRAVQKRCKINKKRILQRMILQILFVTKNYPIVSFIHFFSYRCRHLVVHCSIVQNRIKSFASASDWRSHFWNICNMHAYMYDCFTVAIVLLQTHTIWCKKGIRQSVINWINSIQKNTLIFLRYLEKDSGI